MTAFDRAGSRLYDLLFVAPPTAVLRWTGDLVLALAAVLDSLPQIAHHGWPLRAMIVPAVGALFIRHRRPAAAFLLTVPALVTTHALPASLFTLTALVHRRAPRWALLGAGALVGLGTTLRWDPSRSWTQVVPEHWSTAELARHGTYGMLFAMAPVLLGLLHLAHRELAVRITELDGLRAQERQLHEQRVVNLERARISREMHDVVSHKAGLIAVQAGALEVTTDDEHVRQTAATLRGLAVATLEELRAILLVLRTAGPDRTGLLPQPRLTDLPALVVEAGVDTTLSVAPALTGRLLPEPVGRTIYRTVQESLTNIRKHAPGATTTVRLDTDEEHLYLRIRNGPGAGPPCDLPSGGQGLIGLRERAGMLHGSLAVGPTSDGGFQVRLTLPFTVGDSDGCGRRDAAPTGAVA
ncbi:sensor histidine kinase [Kitasatospora sp. McL0602]|uniref:sensor histidine kinase n=1 Tax=Kitasatospora sp. McL0602 TaxID=3439530 RepID=UPI003F8C9C14